MSKMIVVWILDAGVESFLAVSLGSLRLNAPQFWLRNLKVIIDCGLSEAFRGFLHHASLEGVRVIPAAQLEGEAAPFPGVDAQRQRIDVSTTITSLDEVKSGDRVLVCDPDTVFLTEPDEFPFPTVEDDIAIMPGYTIRNAREVPTPWLRPSTLIHPDLDDVDLVHAANRLGFSLEELSNIKSYNTGVIGFLAGHKFDDPWREAYRELRETNDCSGRLVFAPFMLEQNAMSLCIHRGHIRAKELPRRFNFFPPIRPLPADWPTDTVIVHFLNFRGNHHDDAYRLWFDTRETLAALGFLSFNISEPAYLGTIWNEKS